MKKPLLIALMFSLSSVLSTAQIADGSLLTQNIIFTDLNGNQHDVFALLDEGKTVVMDLFAEWCAPCWNYHNTGTGHPNGGALKTLYNLYGPDGTDELMVFGIESDPSTPEALMYGGAGTNGWDWVTGTPYPMANVNIGNIFSQGYYPYIVRICPNRQIFELGQESAQTVYELTNECLSAQGEVNPALLNYTGQSFVGCEGADLNLSVQLQNLGNSTLTSTTLEVLVDNESLLTYEWSGSLEIYQVANVNLGSLFFETSETMTIQIASQDDFQDDSTLEQLVIAAGQADGEIEVHVYTDFYPSETSWQIRNSSNQIVASGGPYQAGTADQWGGGGPDANTTKIHVVEMPNVEACYNIRILDSYGDGMSLGNNPMGFSGIEVFRMGESIAVVNGETFTTTLNATQRLKTAGSVSVQDNAFISGLSVFPNPSNGIVNVEFSMLNSQNTQIHVYDITGKVILSEGWGMMAEGYTLKQLDLNSFQKGLYIVNITTGDTSTAFRVALVK